jgi:hypothetical protein
MSSSNKTKHIFQISYDTDETEDHTIDAEKLGLAIVSTAKALKNADKTINGESSELDLEVKAHSEGSFVVEFVTYINSAGINPLSVLGFIADSAMPVTVFGAIQQLASRKIKLVEKIAGGKSKLILNDKTELELPEHVADLIVSKTFREDLENIVKAPLEGATNAKFIVKNENDEVVFSINEDNASSFKTIPLNIVEDENVFTENKNVRFIKVNFEGTSGWQVRFPDNETASVSMKDATFLERINKNKQNFSKGDLFVVKLKVTTTHRHGTSPRYKREVIEVIRNRTEGGRNLTD